MTIDEARDVQMTFGIHKGKRLSQVPFNYLRWVSKNAIRKELREAAVLVMNARGKDIGLELKLKPLDLSKIKLRMYERPDFTKGAHPSLQKLWDETPVDLF